MEISRDQGQTDGNRIFADSKVLPHEWTEINEKWVDENWFDGMVMEAP